MKQKQAKKVMFEIEAKVNYRYYWNARKCFCHFLIKNLASVSESYDVIGGSKQVVAMHFHLVAMWSCEERAKKVATDKQDFRAEIFFNYQSWEILK